MVPDIIILNKWVGSNLKKNFELLSKYVKFQDIWIISVSLFSHFPYKQIGKTHLSIEKISWKLKTVIFDSEFWDFACFTLSNKRLKFCKGRQPV